MMTTFERVKSSEWRQGDVIWSHGIKCLVDREVTVSEAHRYFANGPVFVTRAKVLNIDAIEAEDEWLGRFVRADRRPSDGEDVRWTLQGNDLATWQRECSAGHRP